MKLRRLGIICTVVGVAAAVAALELRNAFRREPPTERLTPGQAPLVHIGGPENDFDAVPPDSSTDHALLLEPVGADVDAPSSSAPADSLTPPELPRSESPAHVPLPPDSRRAAIEAVIRRRLPRATDHERRCWIEETRGLSAAQVDELLQLRTQVGPLVSSTRKNHILPVDERPPAADARGVIIEARRIVLGNLLNADSVGYRAVEMTFIANPAAHGGSIPAIASTTISPTQGALVATGRALDVAVEGKAFLLVEYDGRPRLTRFGRLTIDADRKLALDVAGPSIRLSPEIELPSDAAAVRILNGGQIEVERPERTGWLGVGALTLVAVPFPEHLRPAEFGTYAATPRSGAPREVVAGTESGAAIRPGMLEKSNVDRKAELQRLERLDWLRGELDRTEDIPTN